MTGTGPVVAALGGNALVRRDGASDVALEQARAQAAARQLAPLAPGGLVVTHGNAPQVGALAMGAAATRWPVPLPVLVAQSQGHLGHLLQQALAAEVPDGRVVTVLTHVEVDAGDPAFAHPTKPIGPAWSADEARHQAEAHGWTVAPDAERWRRVVASPEPHRVVELDEIAALVAAGAVVVAGGGGGIPVVRGHDGAWQSVDGVVDKDLTSAVLAQALGASALVLLTDVDGVYDGWGPDRSGTLIGRASVAELSALRFDPGTMGPKVAAACRFASATGRSAHIGSLAHAGAVARGEAGTTVEP